MRCRERAQRRELDNGFDAILKQNWQHDDVSWHSLKQAGADQDCVCRKIGDEHAALLGGALPYQAFSHAQLMTVTVIRGVRKR